MPAVTPSTPQPIPRNLGGVCGYLPGKSRPYFYAQSTALDLLCQDLSSDPKNIYFYFIKYCIKVKYLGISPNVRLGGSHPNYPSTPSQKLPGTLYSYIIHVPGTTCTYKYVPNEYYGAILFTSKINFK